MISTGTNTANRTALVTGADGFLGRHIVRHLAGCRWRVVGTVRYPPAQSEPDQPGLSAVYPIDLCDTPLDEILATTQPDVIVHAAGPASVPKSMKDPAADFRASVDTLQTVLDSVRATLPTCRVVFLSSAAVYGNPGSLPISEETPPDPISPYGFHKLIGETLITEYHKVFGVHACSVRIFSAYGPGLRRQVLWDVTTAMLRSSSITLLGTGDETRDFVHVADIARGIKAVIDNGAFEAEVYNLATGCETSIGNLARMLADAVGRASDIAFSGIRRDGDPLHWRADMGRLTALGFTPKISMEQGVAEYAQWVLDDSVVSHMADVRAG